MATPLLGNFDPSVLRKRPRIRMEVLEAAKADGGQGSLYPYEEMLTRSFESLQNQSETGSRRIALPAIVTTKKAKKTILNNFCVLCEAMKRTPEHIKQYICTEQNTEASIDGSGGLVIGGRLNPGTLERYIQAYVRTYVKCPVCGSMDTKLEKKDRLLFIVCNQCTAKNSVQQIKGGFKANTTKRKNR